MASRAAIEVASISDGRTATVAEERIPGISALGRVPRKTDPFGHALQFRAQALQSFALRSVTHQHCLNIGDCTAAISGIARTKKRTPLTG